MKSVQPFQPCSLFLKSWDGGQIPDLFLHQVLWELAWERKVANFSRRTSAWIIIRRWSTQLLFEGSWSCLEMLYDPVIIQCSCSWWTRCWERLCHASVFAWKGKWINSTVKKVCTTSLLVVNFNFQVLYLKKYLVVEVRALLLRCYICQPFCN